MGQQPARPFGGFASGLRKGDGQAQSRARPLSGQPDGGPGRPVAYDPVSYTHLTLPTNREV